MPPYELCIVGAGITGLSLLLLLQETDIDMSRVAIVDPYFDGGDLARRWTNVISNTPWSKTLGALAATCPKAVLPSTPLEPTATAPLGQLATLLRNTAGPVLNCARKIQGLATRAEYATPIGTWTVTVEEAGAVTKLETRRLVLATGGEPRALSLGAISSIPLEIALDSTRLCQYGVAQKKVLVVGTMHSGALVIRNLLACGAEVHAIYNTPQPFVWDRDGAYDGLKGEAAEVADAIQRGDYVASPLKLSPTSDTAAVIRAGREADWVVYAMGFKGRETCSLLVDGTSVRANAYDGATGALTEAPRAWGFGVAYPNRAPDGIHWDVSVAAFLEHMKRQLPALLSP